MNRRRQANRTRPLYQATALSPDIPSPANDGMAAPDPSGATSGPGDVLTDDT